MSSETHYKKKTLLGPRLGHTVVVVLLQIFFFFFLYLNNDIKTHIIGVTLMYILSTLAPEALNIFFADLFVTNGNISTLSVGKVNFRFADRMCSMV